MFIRRPAYRRLVVVDIEATCGEGPHSCVTRDTQEIIELPCVVVDADSAEVVGECDIVVRPTTVPELTPFCAQLTGVSQEEVDTAPTLSEALAEFDSFVRWACLEEPFCVVTDGTWDVQTMLWGECARKEILLERYWMKFFDARLEYVELYYPGVAAESASLSAMLEDLGMKFEGRRHRGIDDARNIARVVREILLDDMASREATGRLGCLGSFTRPILSGGGVMVDGE